VSVALNRRQFLSSSVAGLATANVLLAQTSADRGDLKGVSSSARGWTIPRPMFGFDKLPSAKRWRAMSSAIRYSLWVLTATPTALMPKASAAHSGGNRWAVDASQLSWPGQQMPAPGTLHAEAELEGDAVVLRVTTRLVCRCGFLGSKVAALLFRHWILP
jgi:hypothetical protein